MIAGEQFAHLSDVPLEVEVLLDQRSMLVREILKWNVNSCIRLSRSAGENVDLYVGGALAGFGEIVVIENGVGVRITDFVE
jgi:flagellar motor switch protein FliN/FliY